MSYKNFIPNVWNEQINRDLERLCVFAEDCYRKYEGTVKRKGESVTILGIGKPTIKSMSKDTQYGNIDSAETIETSSIVMPIEQVAYYNYEVGDIDKAQAIDGLEGALQAETSEGLAQRVDTHIAGVIGDEAKSADVIKVVAGTAGAGEINVLDLFDQMQEKLMENDVADGTDVIIDIDPKTFTKFRKEYRSADTDNSKILKNGRVYYYNGMQIKVSNNCAKKSSFGGHNCVVICARTKRAVAFVKPLTHSEAYRPEQKFSDAVKGFILFDAKVVRPKELVVVPVYHS